MHRNRGGFELIGAKIDAWKRWSTPRLFVRGFAPFRVALILSAVRIAVRTAIGIRTAAVAAVAAAIRIGIAAIRVRVAVGIRVAAFARAAGTLRGLAALSRLARLLLEPLRRIAQPFAKTFAAIRHMQHVNESANKTQWSKPCGPLGFHREKIVVEKRT
jgi:hypothetical protein